LQRCRPFSFFGYRVLVAAWWPFVRLSRC